MGLRIRVLGELVVEGEGISELTRSSHRRLVSILALEPGRRIGTERLIDMFWGEAPPDGAKAALQTHISALRRVLGPYSIVTEGYGYRLNLDGGALDVREFAEAAEMARTAAEVGDWEGALASSLAGLGMWRGRPYVELVDDEFAQAEIVHLEEIHHDLWEMWAASQLGLNRPAEALPELERLVVEHPLRERLWEHLMTARYRLGRHAEALRAFKMYTEVLAELGLEPGPSIRRLEEKILLHDETLALTPNNLPVELDSFVGRDRELREVGKLLAEHRLVTLTGAGGSGKTRLAIHVARRQLNDYPDGIWYVELASLRDPDLIGNELVSVMGLSPTEDALALIGRALQMDTALIVLDNCEHLLHGARGVAKSILEAAPRVRIIATTREPLGVPGEIVYEVPGMTLPDPGGHPDGDPLDYDAVRLFLERAHHARASLTNDHGDNQSVVDICHRLDGMPLAIELAAARTATMSPEVMAERLDHRFRLLTREASVGPSRHLTLETAIDWSYLLLTPEEQSVLLQLAVFSGGFDPEMAERVCDQPDVTRIVSNLVSKSLVSQYESPAGRRYRLLEMIRDFALLRLEESGRSEDAFDRHLAWCLDFAWDTRRRLFSGSREGLMTRLHLEADNLLSGMDWADRRSRAEDAGLISEVLARHWLGLGRFGMTVAGLRKAIESCSDNLREVGLHANLADALFWVADTERSIAEAELAYRLAQDAPSSPEKVQAICSLAEDHMLGLGEDPARALNLAREALDVSLDLKDPYCEIRARREFASALAWNGQTQEGIVEAEKVLALTRRVGEAEFVVQGFQWLLHVLYMDPVARRGGPCRVLEMVQSEFSDDDPHWTDHFSRGWVPWAMAQCGQLDRVESNLFGRQGRHLEGWAFVEQHILQGAVRWMQGRLDEAKQDILDAEREGIHPRWYHDYYPLRVDVFADLGELEAARESADFYLNVQVHPTEEIKKVGVLNPVVRAQIDQALSDPKHREQWIAKAQDDVAAIERIISEFPPPIEGSISMETPWTHLAFARAELSRATGPDPALWQQAMDRADFIYFRLYAMLRYGEAVIEVGDKDAGIDAVETARAECSRIGAGGLVQLADGILSTAGLSDSTGTSR